jgi:hypothetical protein
MHQCLRGIEKSEKKISILYNVSNINLLRKKEKCIQQDYTLACSPCVYLFLEERERERENDVTRVTGNEIDEKPGRQLSQRNTSS